MSYKSGKRELEQLAYSLIIVGVFLVILIISLLIEYLMGMAAGSLRSL